MSKKKDHKTKVDELKDVLEGRKKSGEKKSFDGAHGGEKPADLESFTEQLKKAEEEAKEHYDKLLRAMAELDNYKKRAEREKLEISKFSNEQLITDLLPVLDDMDRVLEHLPHGASKELLDFVSGVQLVSKQLVSTLGKYGLEEIKSEGEKFNPEVHEAVAHVPNEDVAADHNIEQHRKGYQLNGRVIRAAMVTVAKGEE